MSTLFALSFSYVMILIAMPLKSIFWFVRMVFLIVCLFFVFNIDEQFRKKTSQQISTAVIKISKR